MSISIPLDRLFHDAWYVLFTPDRPPPDEGAVATLTTDWVLEHAEAPVRAAVLKWLEQYPPELLLGTRDEVPFCRGPLLPTTDLGVEEDAVYRAATHVAVVRATDGLVPMRPGFWSGIAVSRAVARELGGVILDPTRRVLHGLDACREPLPSDGALEFQYWYGVIASLSPGGLGRIDTAGLHRFGLPELGLEDVPPPDLGRASVAVDGVARALLDRVEAGVARGESTLEVQRLTVHRGHVDRALGQRARRFSKAPIKVALAYRTGPDGYPEVRIEHPDLQDPITFASQLARRLGSVAS